MNKELKLIDHTAGQILDTAPLDCNLGEIFPVLKKYGVETIDLSVKSLSPSIILKYAPVIRIELKPSEVNQDTFKQFNHGVHQGIVLSWEHGDDLVSLDLTLLLLSGLNCTVYLKIWNGAAVSDREWQDYKDIIKQYKISGLIYCDRESRLDPFMTYQSLTFVENLLECPLEFCPGNLFGLATANALAAVSCGVFRIHTVVGGANLSEAAAMEEILMVCKYFNLADICEHTENLARDCRKILQILKLKVPVDKAIIGSGIFAHESGIHVDGIIKNPQLYEVIKPEEVGIKRKIVIGKHSGKAAIRVKYQQMGITLSDEELTVLLKKIKQISLSQHTSLSYRQLMNLYLTRNGC